MVLSFKNLILLSINKVKYDYIRNHLMKNIVFEVRVYLLIYLTLILFSFYHRIDGLIYIWLLPMITGQPFLRLFLLAEHGLRDYSSNMLKNSRTTKSNFLLRFFMWNMNYHVEHHSLPSIPYHKLKKI